MSSPEAALAGRVPAESILLVEDDEGDAILVRACLVEAGVDDATVRWVRTLAEALDDVRSEPPSCVLVDLGLPDASGYDVVRALVAAMPEAPVIVLTGRQERDGVGALSAGAQDYLAKDDLRADGLERSIRYAVERTRAKQTQQHLLEARLNSAEQARLERGLLPSPVLHGDAVGCSTYYRPGRDDAVLGGDFFDVLEAADGRVHAVIGDVMGHGPDEAALGVHLRVAWRTLLMAGVEDAAILPTLALLMATDQSAGSRFVTVCDLVLDGSRATVRLAGHPAPVLADSSDQSVRYLDLSVGPPLGIATGSPRPWPANEVSASPGSSFVLYTDGLLEAYGAGSSGGDQSQVSDSLGIDELVAAVVAAAATGRPAASWVSRLVGEAPTETQDDIAAVVLTTRGG